MIFLSKRQLSRLMKRDLSVVLFVPPSSKRACAAIQWVHIFGSFSKASSSSVSEKRRLRQVRLWGCPASPQPSLFTYDKIFTCDKYHFHKSWVNQFLAKIRFSLKQICSWVRAHLFSYYRKSSLIIYTLKLKFDQWSSAHVFFSPIPSKWKKPEIQTYLVRWLTIFSNKPSSFLPWEK